MLKTSTLSFVMMCFLGCSAVEQTDASSQSQTPLPTVRASAPVLGQTRAASRPPTQSLPQSTIRRPGLLGAGLGTLPEPEFQKLGVRKMQKESLDASVLAEWVAGVRKHVGDAVGESEAIVALIIWAPQIDQMWSAGQFQGSVLRQYNKRLSEIPEAEVRRWKEELSKLLERGGGGVTMYETVGFVVQLDRLFRNESFQIEASAALLARIRSLDPAGVEACSNAITSSHSSQAAIMLIQDDQLFKNNQFQKEALEAAIKRLKL